MKKKTMQTKTSAVKRVQCITRDFGNGGATFIFTLILEDGQVFGIQVDPTGYYLSDLDCKLFLLGVGDLVTYCECAILSISIH